ncbi:Uncharacterised protein [Bordetella ansorpii]|uniref:Lipoprotein n=1 Tax=Bordetella ansorpii TaxID=288768 RepID=A0A157MCU6_9BORD|nr:T6SS amidase immunity protein Tai4 family protein [Bordetella ansorpii]SAI06600.1 Uncharacterised protein [Bordetella ansorpii]
MSPRWIAAGALAWPLMTCAATGTQAAPMQAAPQVTEAQRLEKFAVAQCLVRAFPDTLMAADARRASGGYVQMGTSQEDVYGDIIKVVQAHLAKPYRGKDGESLNVMQCLDVLDDPALAKVVRPHR